MATDADIYAYEQGLDEEDEWEVMHAHEMEAAEEEMRAMETAEVAAKQPQTLPSGVAAPPSSAPVAATSGISHIYDQEGGSNEEHRDANRSAMGDAEDSLARAQSRLDQVLARCSTLLGEDDEDAGGDVVMQNTEQVDDYVTRRQKTAVATVDTTTATFLYSRPPIDVDSLPVVLRDGKRMFLRKKRSSTRQAEGTIARDEAVAGAASLVHIRDLMESIERAIALETQPLPPAPGTPTKAALAASNATLWLDKYRPQSFLDLLSDERTNREVLSWIKKWDRFVFPKKKRANRAHPVVSPVKSQGFGGVGKSPWNPSAPQHGSNGLGGGGADVEPEDKRPFDKIILICGPPGAGKTTLANIVARHAGYNPIEVNASDDRTASVLKNKIISAMEMQSIWGDRKPNCLILDEIDGALNGLDGKSAIAAIQEIVAAPLPSKKAGAKTTTKNRHPLTRPLICICNDQYAAVLRPLRQLAKIFVLDTPHPQRLITRLKFICRHEGIKASTGALAALCSSGDNDVRYCLNTLQFQSTQTRAAGVGKSSLATLNSRLVGQKDHTHGVFEAMDLVFYESRSKAAKGELPVAEKIQEAAFSLGNFPLLINGLDENVPKMVFNDPTMNKICDVFEWLGLADAWETRTRVDQQFVFQGYIPFAAIAVHASCCTGSRRQIEYPRAHFDSQKRRERSQNILTALAEGAQLQHSLRMSSGVLVVDVVPWLLATLSPNIRRMNQSLQSKEEKAMIQRLIQLMASLGLSFRPKYLSDGSEDYALEPALHELVVFRSSDGISGFQGMLPANVRKMIAREVELEQMRRSENTVSLKRESSNKTTPSLPVEKTGESAAGDRAKDEVAKKAEAMRKRNPFAFAHREAKRKRDQLSDAQNDQHRDNNGASARPLVRYKFNEGYTCGIKTTVYVRDLL
ncbi:hypothetical protein BBJ28_00019393 [Nothophytophthora sp. Chile5]|nr:hypothetical protein BBJ28_00019393 [Nothophytophthora sp. Chile5]